MHASAIPSMSEVPGVPGVFGVSGVSDVFDVFDVVDVVGVVGFSAVACSEETGGTRLCGVSSLPASVGMRQAINRINEQRHIEPPSAVTVSLCQHRCSNHHSMK